MSLVITQGYAGPNGSTVNTGGYPIEADHLQAFALAAGVVATGDDHLDYRRALASAIAQWERDTGYRPFAATAQTRVYDAPTGTTLELMAGLVSLASVESSDGRDMVLGRDYALLPRSAPASGAPFTSIGLAWPMRFYEFGQMNTVTVAGVYGYAAEVPDDAIEAILSLAASKLVPTRSTQVGAATAIKQDDIELAFSSISAAAAAYTAQQNQFRDTYKAAVSRYKRQVIV